MSDAIIYCRTCRYALNRRDVAGVGTSWEHTRHDKAADHPPAPVNILDLKDPIYRCDFCSDHTEDMVTYIFDAVDTEFRQVVEETVGVNDYRAQHNAARVRSRKTAKVATHTDSAGWCACLPCAELVDAGDIGGLVTRVMEHGPLRYKVTGKKLQKVRGALYGLYEPLLPTMKEKLTAKEFLDRERAERRG